MKVSTKHHYIPACYLKGFTNGGNRKSLFWAFPADKVGSKHGTNPNDACVSNNYYKLEDNIDPLQIENWYGHNVEPLIGQFLAKLDTLNEIDSNNEGFIWLLISLFLRHPRHRASIESPLLRAQIIAKSMQEDYRSKGISLDISETNFVKDDIIDLELNQIKTASYYLPLFQYTIIKAPKNINVITSDSPLILAHPTKKIFGLATKGTMLIAPLNKETLVMGSNNVNLTKLHYASINEIASFNAMIMNTVTEKCFSNNDHFYFLDDQDEVTKYPI